MRGGRRFIALALVGLLLVVGGTWSLRSGRGRVGRSDIATKVAGTLAPTPGPDADGYVRAKRAYLEGLAARGAGAKGAGLVSFSRLMTPEQAAALTRGMRTTYAFAKFPAATTFEAVRIGSSMTAAVAAKASEVIDATKAEIAALQASGTDAALLRQRKEELAQTTPSCACLFAAAVEGVPVPLLARLQKDADVRLVDVPDPLTDDLSGWQLTPILPKASS